MNNMSPWVSINEVRLLEQMNLVWEQHIMWTRMLLISIAENLRDLDATQTRLLRNPKDIANVFRTFYGNEVAAEIQRLLTEHLTIGKELIVALKRRKWWWNSSKQVWSTYLNRLDREWISNISKQYEKYI